LTLLRGPNFIKRCAAQASRLTSVPPLTFSSA